MEKARSAHPWIARYCVRTLQLMPALPTPVAIRWAVSGFPYCADEEPERAAERFVDHHLAGGAITAARLPGDRVCGPSEPTQHGEAASRRTL